MENKALNFFDTDITILVLATFVILAKLVELFIDKYSANKERLKVYQNILPKQPYRLALFIICSYLFVNDLNLPVINLSYFIPTFSAYSQLFRHIVEVVRFFLIIFLLIKEEQVLYSLLKITINSEIFHVVMLKFLPALRAMFFIAFTLFLLPEFKYFPLFRSIIHHVLWISLIWSIAWFLSQSLDAYESALLQKHPALDARDFGLRGTATKTRIVKKILKTLLAIIAGAISFMLFEKTRALGTSIFASAGIIAGIVGLALRSVIENFLVGLQIAFSQPIKINDSVNIEGEFGTIEEITLNYVIVKLWDYRRLIMPIKYFMDNRFINLSRNSINIISTIYFVADHSVPVAILRDEFMRIVKRSSFWDQDLAKLQVVDIKADALYFRGIASSRDSGDAWNLKCEILEEINLFIQKNYSASLPKLRVALSSQESNF